MKKIIGAITTLLMLSISLAAVGDSQTKESVATVGIVDTPIGPISVWKADLPARVWLEERSSGGPCGDITFSIEALLPYSQLDTLNGPEVEFEIWSVDGTRIGTENIWRSRWNPVGPLTKVEISNCNSSGFGEFVMLVRTKYQVSTTGLISRYYENTIRHNIVVQPAPQVPGSMELKDGQWTKGILRHAFTVPDSELPILRYEAGFQASKSSASSKDPKFGGIKILKKVPAKAKSFNVTKSDVKKSFTKGVNFVCYCVRAVSDAGPGEWSNCWYIKRAWTKDISR